MEQKKEYAAVDVFKMFCAILVMLIHTKPFENIFWIDAAIGMLTRIAIPFFFTVSGFFLFKKVNEKPEEKWITIKKYIIRLVRFYIIWFVIFRVLDILLGGPYHGWRYYFKQFFFTTDGSPLWFINALIWAVIIISVLDIWLNKRIIFIIGIILLLIGYCMSTLLGITARSSIVIAIKPFTSFFGIQGGLFFALPYVSMGTLISDNRKEDNGVKKYIVLAVICFLCLGAESFAVVTRLNAPYTFLWISALPMTWFLVHAILTISLANRTIYFTVRKISTLFYVLHVIVFKVLQKELTDLGINDTMNILLTIGTLIITGIMTCGLVRLSQKVHSIKYIM